MQEDNKHDEPIINKETKKENPKKRLSFFKKVLISIKDFDKYNIFTKESFGQAVLYIVELMLIFTLVSIGVTIYNVSQNSKKLLNHLDETITDLTYKDGQLSINNDQKLNDETLEDTFGNIIIDTAELDNTQLDNYKNELDNSANEVLILKDRILIKSQAITETVEQKYSELTDTYNIKELNKQEILDYLNQNKSKIYFSLFISMFGYMFIAYSSSVVVDALLLGILALITGKIAKISIKYTASFNIAAHAITLPLILNIIYIVINGLTGFTIKYFQLMYTAIAYVYIATAIFMMKSDLIKTRMEVQKLQSEQEKLKEKMAEKQEEANRQKEKDEVKDRDKKQDNKSSKKKGKNDEPNIGNKPEGSNA